MKRLSRQFDFTGAGGATLSGRLDEPVGDPLAVVVFAHCFTCSKDQHASARIARALAEAGFAVLRFDFTGLGGSGGDFANTSFSSNVADLLAAAAALTDRLAAPRLLVGHSLGGAAVIKAAAALPGIEGVVTIGAPFGPANLQRLFTEHEAEIREKGVAMVDIAGRTFPVSRDFLDDIGNHPMEQALAGLNRPLLVMHDPDDSVVPVGNADRILAAARHPKSFIALTGAGHLITRAEDSRYAAGLIAAWARHALRLEPAVKRTHSAREEAGTVIVSETGEGRFANMVQAGHHLFPTDEPVEVGGDDTGPGPYQLLLGSLGACTSMTVRMYAERKDWPLERVSVTLSHAKVPAPEGVETGIPGNRIDRIERVLTLEGPLDAEQRARLLEIADKCPVHRTLHARPEVVTRLAEVEPEAPPKG